MLPDHQKAHPLAEEVLSPDQSLRPVSSPTRAASERPSPKAASRVLHGPDEPFGDVPSESKPVRAEDRPTESAAVLDSHMDVDVTTETLTKGKDHSDDREGEPHGKAEPGSPMCQQELISAPETMPSSDVAVTQPFLPSIPRYDKKPRFSAAYETEEASLRDQLEAHRAHAAAECRRCLKASRRAFHELEMTTLDLRAAQHRRELAEAHRKKAHHGQLGIDAESVQ
ncbi:hypothetical protein JVU11DRAFT_345 [Chiua virens]|nr:hypothetical protein JVU11DRAFT_345 [Chiua virens]